MWNAAKRAVVKHGGEGMPRWREVHTSHAFPRSTMASPRGVSCQRASHVLQFLLPSCLPRGFTNSIYLTTWHNLRGGCSEIGILIEIQGIHLRYRIITGVDSAPLPKQYLIGRSRCSQNVWFDFVVVSLLLLIGWTENRKIIIKHFLKTKAKIFAWGLEGCEILRLANSIDGGSGRSLRRE